MAKNKHTYSCLISWLEFMKKNKLPTMIPTTAKKEEVKKLPHYLYLDDEDVSATVNSLTYHGYIEITVRKAKGFESELDALNFSELDGIILDYRLDGNQEGGGVRYKAPALAQELRNRITENQIKKDFPIILCSTDDKIRLLNSDETSNDLFDFRFLKNTELNPKNVSFILNVLSEGYKLIEVSKNDLSRIVNRDINEIDERLFSRFIDKTVPTHEIARHINHQLIRETGLLIDKNILLARLGLENNEKSSNLIEKHFDDCFYTGIFHEGWQRWWMDKVKNKFTELTGKTLASLDATQRVNHLINKTGLDLENAKPIKLSKSNRFWTICQYTSAPLDPLEGYKLADEPILSWQEPRYISLLAIAEQAHVSQSRLTLHSTEKQRAKSALENL
jgi:hypothetical protein